MTERVSWEHVPRNSQAVRALVVVVLGPVVAAVLAVIVALLAILGRLVVAGELAAVLALVVGAGVSWRVLFALRTTGEWPTLPDGVSWRTVAVASVLSVPVLVLAVRTGRGVSGVLAAAWLSAAVVAGLATASGEVVPAESTESNGGGEATLRVGTHEAPTRALSGFRTVGVAGLTACWLSYVPGAGGLGRPRLLVVPTSTFGSIRPFLAAGVDAAVDVERAGRAERAIAAVFGLGILAVGPALSVFVSDAGFLGAYLSAFGLIFAGPMLWYAATA